MNTPDMPGEAPSTTADSAAGPRILVVDDDATLRPAIVAVLDDVGLNVVGEAADGMTAVAAANDLKPDVVIMDMRMPGMTGIEAAEVIYGSDPTVEIIMLTAYADPALRTMAGSVGIGEYLVKGAPLELLLEAIERAWARRQVALIRGAVVSS